MNFADKKGVKLISPFKLHSEQPLDLRQSVDSIEERDELVTAHAAFPGLRVFVASEKKSYIWDGDDWILLSAAQIIQNALTIQFNNGTAEGKDKFTFDGSEEKTINITADAIGAASKTHSHGVATGTSAGFMPILSGNQSQFLRGDGTWQTPPDNDTKYESLKNPYPITFTGSTAATYDGSKAITINIPPGAGVAEVPVGTVLFATSSSVTFFSESFGGTWEVVGNIEATVGTNSSITLYMFKKLAL